MMKFKQIATVAVVGAALVCSMPTMAGKSNTCYCGSGKGMKTCSCTDKKCNKGPCVKNATNASKSSQSTQTCAKNQLLNGKKCAACPANATCKDGKTFTCAKNFTASGSKCVAATCAKGQWMNGSKCTACPANADCKDGKVFTCKKNFTAKGNTCVAAVAQSRNTSSANAKCSCKGGKTRCGSTSNILVNGSTISSGNDLAKQNFGSVTCKEGKLICDAQHSHAVVKGWKVYCECDAGYHLDSHRKKADMLGMSGHKEYGCKKD